MKLPQKTVQEILKTLQQSKRALIISHRNPDPDTLGSNAALKLFLEEQLGIKTVSACVDPVSADSIFLQPLKNIVHQFNPKDYDTFLSVDAGSIEQAAFPVTMPQLLDGSKPFINIDHHASNNNFGTLNLVMEKAASTTQILFHLFTQWNARITPPMATALLHGLYYDTGSFMHSNTSEDALQVGAQLLALGANQQTIIQSLYKQKNMERLRLWGKVFSDISVTKESVATATITQEEITHFGASQSDLSGIIDYLNSVPDTQFATLISEDGNGFVRGSLRTHHDNVNVSNIAKAFGGGGHTKASGFSIKGKLKKEQKWSIRQPQPLESNTL